MKIRGIPESLQQGDLRPYAITLFKEILPELTHLDVTIDRIHHLPKPAYLPDHTPRDVILRLHFYHAKEKLMAAIRTKDHIPPSAPKSTILCRFIPIYSPEKKEPYHYY